jgi:hypothetical protein
MRFPSPEPQVPPQKHVQGVRMIEHEFYCIRIQNLPVFFPTQDHNLFLPRFPAVRTVMVAVMKSFRMTCDDGSADNKRPAIAAASSARNGL